MMRTRTISAASRLVELLAEHITVSKLGYSFILLVPFGPVFGAVRGLEIGGLQHTGFLWMGYLAVAAFVVLAQISLSDNSRHSFPLIPWLLWFGFVWISLAWCTDRSGRNLQEALQLSMPLLIGLGAALFVNTPQKLESLLLAFAGTTAALAAVFLVSLTGVIDATGLTLNPRAMAMTMALCACVSLAGYPDARFTPWLGWGVCVVVSALSGGRTATAVILLLPVIQPLYKSSLWRMTLVACIAIAAVVMFHLPIFQERFFHDGQGTLADVVNGEFLAFGRFAAWPPIYEEAWGRPVLGAGVGSVFLFVPTVWDGVNQVHNDYLRIGFEFGLVGLTLFAGVMLWQLFSLLRMMHRTEGAVRRAFAACFMGFCVWLLFAITDNPTGYNLHFTSPLFALMGAAYAVAADEVRAAEGGRFRQNEFV